ILRNQGNGTFATTHTYGAGSYPARVATGDFNGDGKVDLVVPNYVSANLLIYLGDGNGNFTQSGNFPVGSYPATVVVADLNKDGKLDIASANTFDHTASVLCGN